MNTAAFERQDSVVWRLRPTGDMRVPVVVYATEELLVDMDDKVLEQARNVASLPGIVEASYVMPDGHWGYGFPIGGVAAFDEARGGVISAGGVGFDISCGVRCLLTGIEADRLYEVRDRLANRLFEHIPAGVGSTGTIKLSDEEMKSMLLGGARWAVERGWGIDGDLQRIEENGCMKDADPEQVSFRARERQISEMGTLGSGNHYLEVQRVTEVFSDSVAAAFGLSVGDAVVSIHCGSRGLGHQIGTDYLRQMWTSARLRNVVLPDRELACAPIRSELGQRYLGAMRAGINCALANRQIITHLTRQVFADVLPAADLRLLYDVSHNTCKLEEYEVDGEPKKLYVHRKGATRAFGPGHVELPDSLRNVGQPVFIGGTMGTESWVLVGSTEGARLAFASACHGAGRRMSRHQARATWRGADVVSDLARRGIIIRSPSLRGVAEEAPPSYKDVADVVEAAHRANLAHKVARLEPMLCIKG